MVNVSYGKNMINKKFQSLLIVIIVGITIVCWASNPAPGTLEIIPNPFPIGSEPPNYSFLIIDGKTGLEGGTNTPSITFVCYPGEVYVVLIKDALTDSGWFTENFIFSTLDSSETNTFRYYIGNSASNKFFSISPF